MGESKVKPVRQILIATVILLGNAAYAASITDQMTLIQAIEAARQDGVEISYSSGLVKAWMRVRETPSSEDPVEGLREILVPYQLELERSPKNQWLIVKGATRTYASGVEPGIHEAAPSPDITITNAIDEIIIVASRYTLFDHGANSDQFLSGDEIRLLPHIADDVFRAFHRLPGAAATDFSAPFHLRGGALDETKVILDGLELFEPFHMRNLFSPLSIIDPGIVGNVNVLSGGYTADNGNHMSGVINITSQWAGDEAVHALGVSFLNLFINSSGPWGERGSYQVSARRGYLDLLADAAAIGNEEFNPRYSDVYAKAGFAVSDSTIIDTHILVASDNVTYENPDEGEQGRSENSLKYAWITIDTEFNERFQWSNILSTGTVKNSDLGNSSNLPYEDIDRMYDRDVSVSGFQSDLSFRINDAQLWMFGLRFRHLKADYDYEIDSVRRSEFFNNGLPLTIQRDVFNTSTGNEFGAYARYRFRPFERSTWELGLRWDKQTYTESGDDTQLSPRVNALFHLGEQSDIRIGWGYYYQPQSIQNLQVEDGVTDYFPAARAEHRVVGFRHQFESRLELQMDIYQKLYSDLWPRYENALDTYDYAVESDFDRVRVEPASAESRGVEITLRDRLRDNFDWWLNYTWSKAEDTIAGVNVPRSWDQRHAVTGSLTWHIGKWSMSMVGRYHSGWPQTPLLVTPILDAGETLIAINSDLSQRNQGNYDDYLRVDARLSRTVDLNRGSFQFYVEIFNLFNTDNQCCVAGHDLNFAPTVSVSPNYDSYMPFFPSFGFIWTFGPGAG